MIKITREIIDRCIGFIAGFKNEKAMGFYEVKGKDFPENLLVGNSNERAVMVHINAGVSIAATGEKLTLAGSTVRDRVKKYRKRVAFYLEYKAFIDFVSPVLDMRLEDILGESDAPLVNSFKRKGVISVEDLFNVYTLHTINESFHIRRLTQGKKRKMVFGAIAERCYDLLDNNISHENLSI